MPKKKRKPKRPKARILMHVYGLKGRAKSETLFMVHELPVPDARFIRVELYLDTLDAPL